MKSSIGKITSFHFQSTASNSLFFPRSSISLPKKWCRWSPIFVSRGVIDLIKVKLLHSGFGWQIAENEEYFCSWKIRNINTVSIIILQMNQQVTMREDDSKERDMDHADTLTHIYTLTHTHTQSLSHVWLTNSKESINDLRETRADMNLNRNLQRGSLKDLPRDLPKQKKESTERSAESLPRGLSRDDLPKDPPRDPREDQATGLPWNLIEGLSTDPPRDLPRDPLKDDLETRNRDKHWNEIRPIMKIIIMITMIIIMNININNDDKVGNADRIPVRRLNALATAGQTSGRERWWMPKAIIHPKQNFF